MKPGFIEVTILCLPRSSQVISVSTVYQYCASVFHISTIPKVLHVPYSTYWK